MDDKLLKSMPESMASKSSENEISALLVPSDTDEAKRLKEEATSVLQEKYANIADVDVTNVLKVIGATHRFVPGKQQEITELCISIAFPLAILQCRSLANFLASLSTFDDQGRAPGMAWYPHHVSALSRLESFDLSWRDRWREVFRHWQSEEKDYEGLTRKIDDLRSKLAQIWPIFASIKQAFDRIDNMTGTSLMDITSTVEDTFDMFKTCLAKCAEKANGMRTEKEQQKHLSPYSNTSQARSWTSGASHPPSGIVQRTSWGRNSNPGVEVEVKTTKDTEQRWSKLRERFSISRNSDEDHWTRLFSFIRSPVIIILALAMPPAIYSTILCETPDALPALDSNFWSTLSSCIASFAGLYVIIKPIFNSNEKDKIQTRFPKTFYTVLALSLLTSIASSACYAWNPPASIPLAYVSGLTLNIATLLIIQDSGNQIKQTNRENSDLVEMNEGLADEVYGLETELAGYRGRLR